MKLAGQTGSISPTTLFTPGDSGLYRVTVYLNSSAAGSGTIAGSVAWTDEVGPQAASGTVTNVDTYSSMNVIVRATSGNAIRYSTTEAGTSGAYNLFITVEQLEQD